MSLRPAPRDGSAAVDRSSHAADSRGVTVENAATQDDAASADLPAIIGIVLGALWVLTAGLALIRRQST
jgi:hypothetical protein